MDDIEQKASKYSRRDFLKTIAIAAGGTAINLSEVGCQIVATHTPERPTSFKESIKQFTWEDTKNPEKLNKLVNMIADQYLVLTQTPRLAKENLINPKITNIASTTEQYLTAIRAVESAYRPNPEVWGYAHYSSKKVFIDLETLKKLTDQESSKSTIKPSAGEALLGALFHEWGRQDIVESNHGQLIQNPNIVFLSPSSNQREMWQRYRGAEVYTATFFGYSRFESVINQTIILRRIQEQLGFEYALAAGHYFPNGTDVTLDLTLRTGISIEELYQKHATSDFEGIITLLGSKLPGNQPALEKGAAIATAIHQNNRQALEQTGVFQVIKR